MKRAVLALACELVLASAPARAFVRETTADGQHDLAWPASSFPISWYLQTDPPISTENEQVVIEQFQQWQSVSCADFRISAMPGALSSDQAVVARDGKSEVFWQTDWTEGSAVLALTTPWYDASNGVITEIDTEFNAQDWQWEPPGAYEICHQEQTGCADMATIALHEEGHFLGLAESNVPTAVMYAAWDGAPNRLLTTDDIQGVCTIYPSAVLGGGAQDVPCDATVDCASSLLCASAAGTEATVCSADCSHNIARCSSDDACLASSDGSDGCFPAPFGASPGASCGPDVPCQYGSWCLGDDDGGSSCFEDCDPATSECPSGLTCGPWPDAGPPASLGGFCTTPTAPTNDAGPISTRPPPITTDRHSQGCASTGINEVPGIALLATAWVSRRSGRRR